MIRGKFHQCPFGLPIPDACKCIGGKVSDDGMPVVAYMKPLSTAENDESLKVILEDNIEMFMLTTEVAACPFADAILEDKSSVDCKYDPNQSRKPAGNVSLEGSPLYPQLMIGNMHSPQYGYPLEYYSDNNESRNVYYGLFSLVG
jgi:hypothetical protein